MGICKKCKMEEKGVMSGQGFREFTCEKCGKKEIWHNTNTPKLCSTCSTIHNMCQRCGEAYLSPEEMRKENFKLLMQMTNEELAEEINDNN